MEARDYRKPDDRVIAELRDLTADEMEEFRAWRGLSVPYMENVSWWIENGWRYFIRPVPVRTFLFDRDHMRALDESGESFLWPACVQAVEDICDPELKKSAYVEVLLTGAIGVGKSTIGLYAHAYMLYELLCHRNPHDVYRLDPSSEIMVVFQGPTKEMAKDVDFDRFRAMLDRAPIFGDADFKYNPEVKSRLEFPKRVVVKPIAGLDTSALGQNVVGGQLEELAAMAYVEKSARTRDREAYDQAVELYNAITRRRESRFLTQGEMPSVLTLVSSKKYPDDLIHRKLAEARDNPKRIYTYDKRLWEVKPADTYGKARFRVFCGDSTRKPRLLREGERLPAEDRPLVVKVPLEFRHAFEDDLLKAIRDIAGMANLSIHPFILNRDKLADCFGLCRSVVSRPDCDFDATCLKVYPRRLRGTADFPRYVHLDLSIRHDSCGLAIGHVRGFKRMRRSQTVSEIWPIVRFDLLLEIRPPRGGEINYEKIRRLLYLLRERGMPLKWASCDQFQSLDMMQILYSKGFVVGQESTDKTTAAYECLKTAIYDGRVEAPHHPLALDELTRLERDPKTGKIDHPSVAGSKDVADAMACVVFGLSLQTEVWSQFNVPLTEVPPSLAEYAERNSVNDMDGKL